MSWHENITGVRFCYDCKVGLGKEELLQCFQTACEDVTLSPATVLRWFAELSGSSLLDEDYSGIRLSVLIPENILAILEMLIGNNHFFFLPNDTE